MNSATIELSDQESSTVDPLAFRAACRVCWEPDHTSSLCSPCKCIGTQKHVHLRCLRRWQESLQKRDPNDERAFRCSVCRGLFTYPPLEKPRSGCSRLLHAVRGVGGAICISLLAFGLSGPPWPHLALLVLLLLGTRSHSLLALALLLLGSLLAALHTRGLRLVMHVDESGRLGLALIRHGAPVEGVGPGTLLVASEELEHSIFKRSVVLLLEHGRQGARGIVLSQPMTQPTPSLLRMLEVSGTGRGTNPVKPGAAGSTGDSAATSRSGADLQASSDGEGDAGHSPPKKRGSLAGSSADGAAGSDAGVDGSWDGQPAQGALVHFFGGPVGMPGEGVRQEVVILHSLPDVPGARRVLPPPPPPTLAASPPSSNGMLPWQAERQRRQEQQQQQPGCRDGCSVDSGSASSIEQGAGSSRRQAQQAVLFEGGELAKVLTAAAAARGAGAAQPGVGQRVWVFHGVCTWAEGQLEGELRRGAWAYGTARVEDVTGSDPSSLWDMLSSSDRIGWVQ